ncbi:MAG: hypothetical protein V8S14_02845 [Lachnospiraceae bacterium]
MLVNAINGAETDCVLSMLCSPLQEDFAAKNRALLNTNIFGMGKAAPPWKETSFGKEKVTGFFRRIFRKEMEKQKAESDRNVGADI